MRAKCETHSIFGTQINIMYSVRSPIPSRVSLGKPQIGLYIRRPCVYTHHIVSSALSWRFAWYNNNNNILLYYAHNIIYYYNAAASAAPPLHNVAAIVIRVTIIYEFDRRIKGLCVFYCSGDTRLHTPYIYDIYSCYIYSLCIIRTHHVHDVRIMIITSLKL